MNREQAKAEIRRRFKCADYLTKSKSGLYCCPFCGSGTGNNGTGAVKIYPDTNTWYCHACSKSGDVIDLYQQAQGCDFNAALSLMAAEAGITIDGSARNDRTARPQSDFKSSTHAITPPRAETPHREPQSAPQSAQESPNYFTSGYYAECSARLYSDPSAIEYLQGRGISLQTAYYKAVGFDPLSDPANAPGAMGDTYRPHPCPRIIIPTTESHYIGRSIDPETPKAFAKLNPAGSSPGIFNETALYAQDVQEIFITEGAFDALSVLEAGAEAIALNSAANAGALIKKLEKQRTEATFILCLDNDEAGKKAAETLRAGLQRLNISFIAADICGGRKDPNEALTEDREAFIAAVKRAQRQAAGKPDNTKYYIEALMAGEIERFKHDKKTGFANLDKEAGGLYSGLYVLAAISSLGKTSFALQLADQLAAGGEDVIFFSMEQSRLELVSKSLARRTAQADYQSAVTALQIRKGYLPKQVLTAAEEYKAATGDRLSIIEGDFSCNITLIGDKIRHYIQKNHVRPVVFIDYLQILQPAENERQTTKEAIDTAVKELKRLSRALDLTIIVISSVNRANYLTPIDFEALKESGGIEFTADVVWGLQLQCLNDPLFDAEKKVKEKREKVKQAKAETPREIELCCLKNRYGIANYSCFFHYYPAHDLFTEDDGIKFDIRSKSEWGNVTIK